MPCFPVAARAGTRVGLIACALAFGTPGTAVAAVIHTPGNGASVQEPNTLFFDWAWDSDEYATLIVFAQAADPNDPVWRWGPGQANVDPRRVVVSDRYGPFTDSHATVSFVPRDQYNPDGFNPGQWYWRLCNHSIYLEDDKCGLDAEVRSVTITPAPPPPPAPPSPPSPTTPPQPQTPTPTTERLPTLSVGDTKFYVRTALKRRFKRAYTSGYAKRVVGCARVSRVHVRCKVSWVIGDLSYRGRVRIWLTRGGTLWNYAYAIKRTNEYCLATDGRHCTKTYIVD